MNYEKDIIKAVDRYLLDDSLQIIKYDSAHLKFDNSFFHVNYNAAHPCNFELKQLRLFNFAVICN